MDEQNGEPKQEKVMGEGITEWEMEELVPNCHNCYIKPLLQSLGIMGLSLPYNTDNINPNKTKSLYITKSDAPVQCGLRGKGIAV